MLAWLLLQMEVSDKAWQIIKKGRAGQIWKSNYLPHPLCLIPLPPLCAFFLAELCPCPIHKWRKGETQNFCSELKLMKINFQNCFSTPFSCTRQGGRRGAAKLTLENDSSVIKQSERTKGRPARHCRHYQLPCSTARQSRVGCRGGGEGER